MKEKIYNYTYVLIGEDNRLYIGVHSDNKPPKEDGYWGSSRDITFKPIAKHILGLWPTRKEANTHEIKLHHEFNVVANPIFANLAKAVTGGFSRHGAKSTQSHRLKISKANKGKKRTDETEQKLALYRPSKEHRLNISKAKKLQTFDDQARANMSEAQKKSPLCKKQRKELHLRIRKYSEALVKQVCQLLKTTKMSYAAIEKLTGIKHGTIRDINVLKGYKNISIFYICDNCESIRKCSH